MDFFLETSMISVKDWSIVYSSLKVDTKKNLQKKCPADNIFYDQLQQIVIKKSKKNQ